MRCCHHPRLKRSRERYLVSHFEVFGSTSTSCDYYSSGWLIREGGLVAGRFASGENGSEAFGVVKPKSSRVLLNDQAIWSKLVDG